MNRDEVPQTMLLGFIQGEWPVRAFTEPDHATHWLGEDTRRRSLWRVKIADPVELLYVPPGGAALVERGVTIGPEGRDTPTPQEA